MKPFAFILLLLATLLTASSCGKARKSYPEPNPGWHSVNFSVVFGRLQRVPMKNPDDPQLWVVRYNLASDGYHGELALIPVPDLEHYSGGELVEVHGAVATTAPKSDYPGTWYEVQSIKLWSPYKGQ